MGLIIKSTESKKIHFKNSNSEIEEVYARITAELNADGKTIVWKPSFFANKGLFEESPTRQIATDIKLVANVRNVNGIVAERSEDTILETFSISHALEVAKDYFEEQGFQVEIL